MLPSSTMHKNDNRPRFAFPEPDGGKDVKLFARQWPVDNTGDMGDTRTRDLACCGVPIDMPLRIGNVRTVVVLEIQRALVHVAIDDAQLIPPKISLGDRTNPVARAVRLFRTLREYLVDFVTPLSQLACG
jgi:hypothetical protein